MWKSSTATPETGKMGISSSRGSKWHLWVPGDNGFLLLCPVRANWCHWYPREQSLHPSFPPSGMSHGGIVSSSFPSAHLSPIRQEKCVEMKGAVCNFQQLELPRSAPKMVEFQSVWACEAHSHSAHLHSMPPKIFWRCLCAHCSRGERQGHRKGAQCPLGEHSQLLLALSAKHSHLCPAIWCFF